jgi:signal peptidase I
VADPVAARPPLAQAVERVLSPPERALAWKLKWVDRLVSLWAPVTLLALVTGAYITVVESVVCTSVWLQPAMQGLGLVCFAWWAVLVVGRFGLRAFERVRKARYHAEEVLAEVERTANKHRASLKDKQWEELVEGTAGLLRTFTASAEVITEATKKLEALSDKHLAKFRGGGWLDFGSGFVRALVIALAFRALLIEPYKIPSGSMIPTLAIGDQIFVNKFIYGVRLPFTNYVPFVLVRAPKRGDVIVFNNPANEQFDYVKRVVGIAGDRLEFTEQGVVINGTPLARTLETPDFRFWDQYNPLSESFGAMLTRWRTDDWRLRDETLFRETLDGQQHQVLDNPGRAALTLSKMVEPAVTVPQGHVFVMGDNRNNSDDSRFGLGDGSDRPRFVPFGNIKGKATIIWLSLSRGGFGSGFFGGTGIRYDRFFKPVTLCGSQPPMAGAPTEQL